MQPYGVPGRAGISACLGWTEGERLGLAGISFSGMPLFTWAHVRDSCS